MTVEELRELLASMPPTARVVFRLEEDDDLEPSGATYEYGQVLIDCCIVEA